MPQSFSAWVWKIAGNRYARWADKRRKLRENTAGLDVSEYDLPDCDSAVDSDMILREQISLMRRELAFISSDYRRDRCAVLHRKQARRRYSGIS